MLVSKTVLTPVLAPSNTISVRLGETEEKSEV